MMGLALDVTTQKGVFIATAEKGNKYVCLACETKVFPIKGEIKTHHFRHQKSLGKSHQGGNSPLHEIAKKIIQNELKIRLPNNRVLHFDSVELERPFQRYKIDAVGYCGSRRWYIEVKVTHGAQDDKVTSFRHANVNAIQLDLSAWHKGCPTQVSSEAIRRLVLHYAPVQWLHKHRQFNRLYQLWERIKVMIGMTHDHVPEQLLLDL